MNKNDYYLLNNTKTFLEVSDFHTFNFVIYVIKKI